MWGRWTGGSNRSKSRGTRLGFSPSAARATWTALLIVSAVYGLWIIRDTLFVFVLALFFVYMVCPLVDVVERYKPQRWPRSLSIGLVFAVVLAGLGLAISEIGSAIVSQAARLGTVLPATLQNPHWIDRLSLPHVLEPWRTRIDEMIQAHAQSLSDNALPIVKQASTKSVKYLSNTALLILVPILAILMMKDASQIESWFMQWMETKSGSVPFWKAVLTDLNFVLSRYVRALLLLSLSAFSAYAIGLPLLGVPYPFLLAAVAGALEFLPLLGPLSAAVIILLVAAFSGYSHFLALILFFILFRVFQDYVVNPYLMSSGVELHPLVVIFGILAGEHLGGIRGIILSVPVLSIAKIIVYRLRNQEDSDLEKLR
jgi:predicted PurR-regulated permease PerM